jgi:hypothetical protein
MKYDDLKKFTMIPESELKSLKKLIKEKRKSLIKSTNDIVSCSLNSNKELIKNLPIRKNVTETIVTLREKAWELYLIEESNFNEAVICEIGEKLDTPQSIINLIIDHSLDLSKDDQSIIHQITLICGAYAGRIAPYIYELCLSNTNSRRSRAGKTFEIIIYKLYEAFNYPYSSQATIGKRSFDNVGLGKMVDSILPNIKSFQERRDKTIIGTMKTTLRERWQEVAEELHRTGVPCIHLLTMDDQISTSNAKRMAEHNIIIVVPQSTKEKKLHDFKNIISFETYFFDEIPTLLEYWKKQ